MTGVQTCALPICFPVTIHVIKQIEAQIEQWSQENIFTKGKLDLEEERAIADTILRGIEIIQGIGRAAARQAKTK